MVVDSPRVPDTISFRRAELRDVHHIRRIDAEVYPTPWSEKLTLQQVTGPGRSHLVAEESHRVVAHAGLVFLDGDAHIATIAVSPAFQRRGIADEMMRHLFAVAQANGCAAITLEVRSGNEPAIALYERHGFVVAGRRPGYYADNREDALIMWSHGNDSVGMETDA